MKPTAQYTHKNICLTHFLLRMDSNKEMFNLCHCFWTSLKTCH